MNEHEKLETALDLLEIYAHRNGLNDYGDGRVWLGHRTDRMVGKFLEACGRFRVTETTKDGALVGYWRDEDPERKAGK